MLFHKPNRSSRKKPAVNAPTAAPQVLIATISPTTFPVVPPNDSAKRSMIGNTVPKQSSGGPITKKAKPKTCTR